MQQQLDPSIDLIVPSPRPPSLLSFLGLMSQDWAHYDERKMKLLAKAQPDPSTFAYEKATNQVCVRHGAPANPECAGDLGAILYPPDKSQQQQQQQGGGGYNRYANVWAQGVNRLRGAV